MCGVSIRYGAAAPEYCRERVGSKLQRPPRCPGIPAGHCPALALYIDGVPYSRHDGFLGFWVYNLITWKRHLAVVLRKSQMCACGCRKWCSLWPVFRFLQWSLRALADGRWPAARHDAAPWAAEDATRAALAGSPLPRGALVLLKGDWSEVCLTLGVPTWSSTTHPCFLCASTRDALFSLANFAPTTFPHDLKPSATYAAACAAAECRVVLTAEAHRAILPALRFDKRRDGARGRALTRDIPALGLAKGDRLEPSPGLPDVGLFDGLSSFPVEIIFWRRSAETSCLHRNPLFDAALGVGLESIGVDVLHTLHLGVFQKLVAKAWWTLLLRDAWGVAGAAGGRANQDELVANGCLRLRRALFDWYDELDARSPGLKVNRLTDLVVKTLGDQHACQIRTKAAETRPLLAFTADLLARHAAVLPPAADALPAAARELAHFADIVRTLPQVLSAPAAQALHDSLKRYMVLADRAGVPRIPKLHLAMHMVHRTLPASSPFPRPPPEK